MSRAPGRVGAPRRLLLLAAVLILGALCALPDRSAEAQTVTYDVWTATLWVDTLAFYAGCSDPRYKQHRCSEGLSDDTFTYAGSTYRFTQFYIEPDVRFPSLPHSLHVTFDKAIPATVRNALTLHVGSTEFALSGANWSRDRTSFSIANSGLGPWRDDQRVSLKLTAADTALPAKPSGFSATPGDRQVTLAWTNPDDPTITKYQVHVEKAGSGTGSWQDVPGSGPGTTSHTLTGLQNGAAYTFRIRAVDNRGNGEASTLERATPRFPASRAPAPAQVTPLGGIPASGLRAIPGDEQVALQWDNPNFHRNVGVALYTWEYQQRAGSADWSAWRTAPGRWGDRLNRSPYELIVVTGLSNGTAYSFRVRGLEDGVETVRGETAAPVTPHAGTVPVRLTLGPQTDQMTLEWTPQAETVVNTRLGWGGYYIELKKTTEDWDSADGFGVRFSHTSHVFRDLEPGTAYTARVWWNPNKRYGDWNKLLGEATAYTAPAEAPQIRVEPSGNVSVRLDWPYVPPGLGIGQSFRLLFVTSTTRNARSSDIADYNTFVQTAANTNAALYPFKDEFHALISTPAVDARNNAGTIGVGVPIYWLGGAKAADDYPDFYDGSWDSGSSATTETGSAHQFGTHLPAGADGYIWTGSKDDGTKYTMANGGRFGDRAAGHSSVIGTWPGFGLSEDSVGLSSGTRYHLLALSPVFTVTPDPSLPRVRLELAASRIAENGTGNATTVKATLASAVSSATTVSLTASPAGKVALGATTLTIPAGATESAPVTVTAVNDDVDAADALVNLSGTLAGAAVVSPPRTVVLTVTDDDTKGITIAPTDLSVNEGASATYTVALDSEPLSDVVVTPASADTGAVTVSTAATDDTLTFTPSNWATPQQVTVTGVQDGDYDDESVTVTHTASGAGSGYESESVDAVTVAVDDDEAPPTPPAAQTVPADSALIPKDSSTNPLFTAGQSFRLLFVTSTTRDARSANIADYNTFVQTAANTNANLRPFKGEFRALISTATVDARDNAGTIGAGEPIYWVGGAKAADDYPDFYDGSWDSGSSATTETGSAHQFGTHLPADADGYIWTGSKDDGTKYQPGRFGNRAAGNSSVIATWPGFGLSEDTVALSSSVRYHLLALSPVFKVSSGQMSQRGEPGTVGPPDNGQPAQPNAPETTSPPDNPPAEPEPDAPVTRTGTNGRDDLEGGGGDDLLIGLRGGDVLRGKGGHDELRGGHGHDKLFGGAGDDELLGGKGHDELRGGRGADRLSGGDGDDTYTGGPGNDRFIFVSGDTGDKIITDFGDGGDRIVLQTEGGSWPAVADIIAGVVADGSRYYVYTLSEGLTVETDVTLRARDFVVE